MCFIEDDFHRKFRKAFILNHDDTLVFCCRLDPSTRLGKDSSSCSVQRFWHMTESDAFHVFDGSAENVISISSYIETAGLFFNGPLSKGLYRPSDNDGVLTCVDSLFICGLCWNPPQNQLKFWQIPGTKHRMLLHSGTIWSQLPLLARTGPKHEALETILTV